MQALQPDDFIDALKKNETPRILHVLKEQPSLADTKDKSGVTAVFLALYRGNTVVAREIAARKSGLDVFEAAALGDLVQLKSLVDRDPSLVRSYSPDGFTALALASYLGLKGSTEYLIEKGAEPNAVAKNETGFTALTGAASQNHTEVARLLVKHGANVNHSYEGGFTPLMHAASAGNLELVNLLLQNGADPNAKNAKGKTPFTFAIEKGDARVVSLLKSHGAT
jgi:ankyrin repeat protein